MVKYFLRTVSLAILGLTLFIGGAAGLGIFGAYISNLIGLSMVAGYILTLVMLLIVIICILAAVDTYEKRERFK